MVERGLSIVVGGEGDASGGVGLCWWLKVEKKSNPNAIEHMHTRMFSCGTRTVLD